MSEKYIYWGQQIFGKGHLCTLFALNGKTSLKYFGKQTEGHLCSFGFGEFSSDMLYSRMVTLNPICDNTKTEFYLEQYFPNVCASIPAKWAGNYVFEDEEHIYATRQKWLDENPTKVNWRKVKEPGPTTVPEYLDANISATENTQRILDIVDPDLICTTTLLKQKREHIDIDLTRYKHYLPYKSEEYKYLLLDLLCSTDPKKLKSFDDVEEVFKEHIFKFKSYMRFLEKRNLEWEWVDISKDEEYKKKFNLEKTFDYIIDDPRWLDPVVITDKTRKCLELVDKYFEKYYDVLNLFYPKVLS